MSNSSEFSEAPKRIDAPASVMSPNPTKATNKRHVQSINHDVQLLGRAKQKQGHGHKRSSFPLKLWLSRIEAACIFVGSCVLAGYVVRERAQVMIGLDHVGFWSYPIAIALLAIVASAPFSVTDALAVMNGVIFGPIGGTIVNGLGILAAAVVGYAVACRTSALLELDKKVEHLPSWVKRYRVGSFPFLVAVRVIPGIGGTIATQVAAAMKVPLYIHVAAMAAIAIPICTALAIGGDSLAGFVQHHLAEPVNTYMHTHKPHFGKMHFSLPSTSPRTHEDIHP